MIVLADIHLGKVNDSFLIDGVPSQTHDIVTRLNAALVRAKITRQCIVLAGDIFNKVNPTTQTLAVLFAWLSTCSESNVDTYIIAGNHDGSSEWVSTSMFQVADLKHLYVITQPDALDVFEAGDSIKRECVFWPHMPLSARDLAEQGHGSISKYVSDMFPKAEFIITHGTISGEGAYQNDIFFEAGDSMRIEPTEFRNLKLMVLGHIHDHKEGKGWAYPGSVTINNFGEVDEEKGWIEVDLKTLSYVWYPYPDDVTPWVHVELDFTEKDETSLDEEVISELVSGAIVKITVLAKSHGIIDEVYIKKLFNKYGHVTRFETVVISDIATNPEAEAEHVSNSDLLDNYLSTETDASKEDRANAIRIGMKIIAEAHA